ncbi:uncharacterized protein LOC135196259 [Macrobrachium nipponense]|uniref:uncharacterized protein LOC135196259 n=1 Tax=Macrobrachium nipponense TaxID=159736 RepID=UPI0030C88670
MVGNVLELLSGEGWQERLAELNREDLEIVAQHFELEYEVSIRKGVLLLQIYEYVKTVKAGGEQEVKPDKGLLSVEILDRQIALRQMEFEIEKFKAEEREKERQHEIAMRDTGSSSSPPPFPNRSVTPAINLAQALKFVPKFEENNVAEFFVSFERIAARLEWLQEYWTTLIQSKLVGRAQRVYVTLEEDLSSDYESVKAIVLKAYELVPEAYRQRFRNLEKIVLVTWRRSFVIRGMEVYAWRFLPQCVSEPPTLKGTTIAVETILTPRPIAELRLEAV